MINIELINKEIEKVKKFNPNLLYVVQIGFGEIQVRCWTETYEEGCNFLRFCGRKTWIKHIGAEPTQTKWITSKENGLEFTAFFNTLPPTCRIVEVTEKVPKTQTVETGEYIEIKRQKVVCGPEETQ